MLKKIGILFLVILLCICSMTSCVIEIDDRKEGGETSPETSLETDRVIVQIPAMPDVLEQSKTDAQKALDEVFTDKNLEGVGLNIVIVEDTKLDFSLNSDSTYSRALKQQSMLISSKLGCNLTVTTTPYDTFLSDAQSSLDAGLFYADLVCVPQKAVGYLKNRNMIADLNALYGDVFSADCYNALATSQASGNNKIYGVVGDAAVSPGAYTCVYLNKTVSDAYGFTQEIYDAVNNGSWTLDFMLSYKAKCIENHPDIISVGAVSNDEFIETVFGASGMNYMTASVGALPAVANNGARLDSLVAKLKEITGDASSFVGSENAYELFEQEKVLFYVDTLEVASTLKGNYTVLPMPKADAEQDKYYTPANENAYVFCVLTSNNRTEYAVDLLRAFNETGAMLSDACARDFLDFALRNEQSYNYVKEIFKNPVYDFAYMYGEYYPSVAASSYGALQQAVTTRTPFTYYTGRQAYALRNDLNKIFS